MIDNVHPATQFHPYQPPDVLPHSDTPRGWRGMLGRMGIDGSKIDALEGRLGGIDVRGPVRKVRGMAKSHPAAFLGGLAAVAIGAGLLRRRSMTTGRIEP